MTQTARVCEMILETRIDRVTVHRNGALIVRKGLLDAPESQSFLLVLPGLPLLFASDTVRVSVAGATVGPVEEDASLALGPVPPPVDAQERVRLAQVVAAAEDAVRAREALATAHTNMVVEEDPDFSAEAPVLWPEPEAWAGLHDAVAVDRERNSAALAVARRALTDAQRALERFERANDPANAPAVRYTRALRTHVEDAAPTKLAVEVEYFSSGARWAPTYALDINADQARLTLSALVAQATGEDWRGARVAVASADLRRSTTLSPLGAWRIGRTNPEPRSGWRSLPEDMEGLFADFDAVDRPRAVTAKPTPKRAPRPAPRVQREEADDESLDMGGMAEEPAPKKSRARTAEATAFFGAPRGGAAAPAPSAPPPPQSMAAAPSMDMARRVSGPPPGAMGGGGAMPEPPPPPPPPRPSGPLDYAWLRLPNWHERGRRGRLWPVDAHSDLVSLAEERGVGARLDELKRAIDRLREDGERLDRLPLPPGCTPLSGSAFPFRYPHSPPADVPSDGRFHQLPVCTATAVVRQIYRVVPRQSPSVFRFALMPNALSAPLPAGPLRVSLDGAWRITSALSATGAGGQLSLNLGVEEGLRVARNSTYQESERGVLSTVTVASHRVLTEVQSRLERPVEVEVYERLPQAPEGSDLSVTLDETTPQPRRDKGPDGEREEGALAWTLQLAPGERASVKFNWSARVPNRMEIVGGNRREP